MKKLIFAVAIACVGAQFAHAEQVQNWFTGYAEGSTAKASNGAWPAAMPKDVTVADAKFTLETDYANTLDFTPTASAAPDTNVMTRVVTVAKFEACPDALPAFTTAPKTALVVKDGKYNAYANGNWVELAGGTPSDAAVNVLAEVDYKSVTARARFGIIDGTTTNYLYASDAEEGSWLTLATTPDPALISTISFMGDGEVVSVKGDVQLGIFENKGIKYGTADEAVASAQATGDDTITVLRDNSENITIPETGGAVAINSNGKECSGTIVNNNSEPMQVELSSGIVDEGNGDHELTDKDKVNGKYVLHSSDETKDVVAVTNDQGVLVARVTTKDSVIDGKLSVAGKTLTVNDKLKTYLTTYGGNAEGSYAGKNSSDTTIKAQLDAKPTGADRTMGQSYALGLEPTEAIVLQPAEADTDTKNVTLAMPNVEVNSDFSVTYQVQKHDGTNWVDDGNPTATPQIPVGSGRFRVNTVIAPAN